MAARFFGRYEHSLDIKGRVILPARFRTNLGPQAYLSQFQDRCLALWTPEEFEKQSDDYQRRQEHGRTERNLARIWSSGSVDVEVDRQGRVAIPAFLRSFARLESAVLVVGALNRVELWNPGEWETRVLPAEAQLTDGDGSAPGAVADPTVDPTGGSDLSGPGAA